MTLTRLRLGVGVLVFLAVFSVVGEWYFGDRRFARPGRGGKYPSIPEPSVRKTEETYAPHLPHTGRSQNYTAKETQPPAPHDGTRQRRLYTTNHTVIWEGVTESAVTEELRLELRDVSDRIDTCLMSVNMSAYFKREGLYWRAQINARDLLASLRRIVPKFEEPYSAPCWNVSFFVKRDSFMGLRGYIEDLNFTYSHRMVHRYFQTASIIRRVQWSHGPKEFYIKQSSVCLPKIFLLGYPKCGSTYLYCLLHRVLKHSLGTRGRGEAVKEPHWWVVPGPRGKAQSLEPDYIFLYLLNFHRAASMRERSIPALTIDASPNLMFQWPRYSESESLENYCLLPSLLPVVLPDSKYFVIMRNPISMLYSAFWFSCTSVGQQLSAVKFRGPDIFHKRITRKIDAFNECKNQGNPLDLCVDEVAPNLYGPQLPNCGRTRLEMGLYYFHARKWLSVVPRSRILFFTLEEVAAGDLRATVDTITDFLELPPTSIPAELDLNTADDFGCNENSQHVIDYKNDPRLKMRDDTRQILVKFFQPYNRMLADLLGDDKYLWNTG